MKKKQQPEYQAIIKFDRNNATYRPEQLVSGNIMYLHDSNRDFKLDVNSVSIRVRGSINVVNKNSNKTLEAIKARLETVVFVELSQSELVKNKTLTSKDRIPFKFKLETKAHKYIETYIGVFLNVVYEITVETKVFNGGVMSNDIPFYLQVAGAGREAIEGPFVFPKPKYFMITNNQIQGDTTKIPKFKVKGQITTQICQFGDDFNGFLIVDQADTPIRSIDLQMIRVQRIQSPQGKFSQKTQIQLIQICDGNVTRDLQIPIYMIFPRYFSCPSLKYMEYRVDFEVNLLIIFRDGFKVTVNLPVKIIRS